MPVSVTSARVAATVPDAVTLTQTALNQIVAGAKDANIARLVITLPWSSVQTGSRTWNWAGADRAVNTAVNAGLGVQIVLDGPIPSWAGTVVNPTRFAAYAGAVAARYRRKVKRFQVWNYPNVSAHWSPGPDAVEYVAVLRSARSAIKRSNPSAKVIFGSLQAVSTARATTSLTRTNRGARFRRVVIPSEITPATFLNSAYTAGAKGLFEFLAYTPLSMATVQMDAPPAPSGDSIKQSDDIRQVMIRRGDARSKMLWTFGYDTDVFTTTQQSLYLDTLRRLAETRKDHVVQLAVHTYRDQA